MNAKPCQSLFLILLLTLLPGCISIPPLIQVQHKQETSDQEMLRRLEAIDRRLERLEKADQK
jgi:starvation-inducible outer membrane lipoprotein